MDPEATQEPMVTDEPQKEAGNFNSVPSSDNMNISIAFKKITSKDPQRFTEFCEAINKTFDNISDGISQDEFKQAIGDVSFLKRKKNLTNLFTTFKTQINTNMIKHFGLIVEDENLSELFGEKTVLNIEETKKYAIDDDSIELIELEESLHKLDVQIAELEETNEVLFNQGKFNQQRYNQLSDRITKLLNECQTKYINDVEQTEVIREEFISILKNQ